MLQHGKERQKAQIEDSLFEKIALGDEEAFRQLYYSSYKQIFAFLLSLCGNYYDAEDLMQEVYIKIRRASGTYEARGKAFSWMFKIAKNEYLGKCRKEKAYANMESMEILETQIGQTNLGTVEDRMMLQTAFHKLSKEERNIITLHLISGLKHREIAEILEKPLSTVLSRYNRALKKMKEELKCVL